jgi:hypothetical protein
LQIIHAQGLSDRAKEIKIADKICNVRDITHNPPEDWSLERKQEYLGWAEEVVKGCRGTNPGRERRFDEVVQEGRSSTRKQLASLSSEPCPRCEPRHDPRRVEQVSEGWQTLV